MKNIAICITTRNRNDVLFESLNAWYKFRPKDSALFIVDDASSDPYLHATYHFKSQQGVAKAKNKCLELSHDYEHIFLVDDDVRPKVMGWERPYIDSGMNHLCLTFEKNSRGKHYSPSIRKECDYNGLVSYTAPNGCFLYLKKICLEKAGGLRPEFGLWGYEHVEYSSRIHALGLTPKPFLDVPDSLDLIEVLDYTNSVKSCLSSSEKGRDIKDNFKLYRKYIWSKDYVPFV